ncbi:MAG: IS66 family transposase [Myxococcota bacterium]
MLRRREGQLKRSQAEVRKLRKKLGLGPEDEPEPDPPGARVDPPDDTDADESPSDIGKPRKKRPRSRGGRRPPSDHLPAETEHHAVDACGACGGRVFKRDVVESVKYTVVPQHVRRRVIRRERVLCAEPACNVPTTAPMPPMPCDRALYDCSFLAWLVTMKFALLVPLDRIRMHLKAQGIDLAMGTLVHLIARAVTLVDPIDGEHFRQLLAGDHLCFDGTGLKTLIVGQDQAWDGYLEVFTRDELTVFQFDLTKHSDRLKIRLNAFDGIVVCDAESRNAAGTPGRTAANCNAHPLRAFRDAERVQPRLAAQGKRFIQALYTLEDQARDRGLEGDALVAFRRHWSRRVLNRFRQWLAGVVARDLPPSDPVGATARFYLRHFADLTRFVDHAHIPLDNNQSEREFQRHAKLRLASLFAGSPDGGHRWATLLGVVRTAQKCGVDVQAYLTWLFERRGTHRKAFVGADGAHSTVRQMLGIERSGRGHLQTLNSVLFRADLEALRLPGVSQYEIEQDDFRAFLADYGSNRWALMVYGDGEVGPATRLSWIQRAIGRADIPVEPITTGRWELSALIAARFSDRRVFLAGDAAHALPPTRGGFGANTGIHDAWNLAWKLSSVLDGTSEPTLLDTYDGERRPVAWLRHDQTFARPDYSRYTAPDEPNLELLSDEALELGERVESDAVAIPSKGLPLAATPLAWAGQPGTRAPHQWVRIGVGRVSTLDLFHRNWVVVAGARHWLDAAGRAADSASVGLVPYEVGVDVHFEEGREFGAVFGVPEDGAVLVRPDGIVAWRSITGEGSPDLVRAFHDMRNGRPPTTRPSNAPNDATARVLSSNRGVG